MSSAAVTSPQATPSSDASGRGPPTTSIAHSAGRGTTRAPGLRARGDPHHRAHQPATGETTGRRPSARLLEPTGKRKALLRETGSRHPEHGVRVGPPPDQPEQVAVLVRRESAPPAVQLLVAPHLGVHDLAQAEAAGQTDAERLVLENLVRRVRGPERVEKREGDARADFLNASDGFHTRAQPFYNLMMFPYPSAEGLHVGNIYAFTGADIYGRWKRLQGETCSSRSASTRSASTRRTSR
jgi:hypothetical protein